MTKYPLALIALILLFGSCQESSSIGNNLLDDERFDIQFKKDFSLTSSSKERNNVASYTPGVSLNLFTTGVLEDPVFGTKTNDVFFSIIFNASLTIPDFSSGTLDSMVLILTYDSLGIYGDRSAIHNLDVHALDHTFVSTDTIYMNEELAYKSDILGSKSFVANPVDSFTIINHTDTTGLRVPAQIRIRMDDVWSQNLFTDRSLYDDNASLKTYLKGFYITDAPSSSALLGLDMSTTANSDGGLNRLQVYYTDTSNFKRTYSFRIGAERGTLVKDDSQNTLASQLASGTVSGDSVFVVDAFNGLDGVINFNDLSFLDDKIINHAIVKVFIADLPEDDLSKYDPIIQMLAGTNNDEGNFVVTKDISDLTARNISIVNEFGGTVTEEDGKQVYEMNVTKRLKEIIEKGLDPTESNLILSPISRNQLPNRTVLYGAGHSQYPIKLEVTYTLK